MKKLITANDIREAHARGEQAMSVVLRASIITPEAREVADLLGFTITECDESIPVTASVPASVPADKTESQRIRETIIAQLPEGQFTESLVAQLMEKVMRLFFQNKTSAAKNIRKIEKSIRLGLLEN